MSRDDLSVARRVLAVWPTSINQDTSWEISDACRRLLHAAAGLCAGTAGWRDVASLVRQVLLTSETTYLGRPSLSVPAAPPWPSKEQWAEVHCRTTDDAVGRLTVRPDDWEPPTSRGDDPISAELARQQVRAAYRDDESPVFRADRVPADPFWQAAHGYPDYRGESQRQAARASVLDDGGALLIALPTGRGKTAVAWSRVLMSTQGVTIVVVPTVVLALDMERRTAEAARSVGRELGPLQRFAYVGSLDPVAKEQLRDAVRTGMQRLIYTSPEAFVSGLASAVLECARRGYLQQIIVDEAHLVDQWGTDFRPEFQTMPGLIRDAHASAPAENKPTVVMLSATLAQRPVDLITRLFAVDAAGVDLIWGSELRTEPAFFLATHDVEEDRRGAVLEAVSCLPRPLILYTTKVEHADEWVGRLRAAGFSRVESVTGESNEAQRRTVMERWRGVTSSGAEVATSLDMVVGTSAFGLGLDMPNVRTVIHACLPETIDRYYQEVGRSGRDGRPSIAYLCVGPGDLATAELLSEVSMIGDERGWVRWRRLLRTGQDLGGLRYRVRKSTLPTYLSEGYRRSAQWNVRTLTLMAQAGIIQMRVPQWKPQAGSASEDEEASKESFYNDLEDFIEFELVNGEMLGHDGWVAALGELRDTVRRAQRAALNSVIELTEGHQCFGRVIARHYRIQRPDGTTLRTEPACRGCPACRQDPASSPGIEPLSPIPLLPQPRILRDPLERWREGSPSLFAWYVDATVVDSLLLRLAQRGVQVYAGLAPDRACDLQTAAISTPIILDDPSSASGLVGNYAGPLVYVLQDEVVPPLLHERVRLGMTSYILGPATTIDPDRPDRLWRDTAPRPIPAEALLRSL